MESLIVEGGRPLFGSVRVRGAKNASLPALAATVLAEGESAVEGVPRLSDIDAMVEILEALGARVTIEEAPGAARGMPAAVGSAPSTVHEAPGATRGETAAPRAGRTLRVDARTLGTTRVPDPLVRRMRSSIFLMGPLLARFREVTIGQPGGCSIGPRPIDLHLKGLRQMGAIVEENGPQIHARLSGRRRLAGADITLSIASVGATENLMMAATLAEGRTVIRNAAREPEIRDLADFLNAMGARVEGAGGDVVCVDGVERLHPARHRVVPDRIEAGTLLLAIAATGGRGTVCGCRAAHLDAVLAFLREAGCDVSVEREGGEEGAFVGDGGAGDDPGDRGGRGEGGGHGTATGQDGAWSVWDRITVAGPARPHPVDIRTQPYPGFPTDLQNPALAFLLRAEGTSLVSESVFDQRFQVVAEFRRMGASLMVDGRTAIVRGVPELSGAWVEARELRGGAALIIAALAAVGESRIDGLEHVDRGYEAIEALLRELGARVVRASTRSAVGDQFGH